MNVLLQKYVDLCLSFCLSSFGHFVVCSSFFFWPLCCLFVLLLLAIVLSVRPSIFDLGIMITALISSSYSCFNRQLSEIAKQKRTESELSEQLDNSSPHMNSPGYILDQSKRNTSRQSSQLYTETSSRKTSDIDHHGNDEHGDHFSVIDRHLETNFDRNDDVFHGINSNRLLNRYVYN